MASRLYFKDATTRIENIGGDESAGEPMADGLIVRSDTSESGDWKLEDRRVSKGRDSFIAPV